MLTLKPKDVGEFWFARRRNFDINTYRVKCKCKHSHDMHDPTLFNCKEKGCGCSAFNSDFLCAACDQHWERHETFFETEKEPMSGMNPLKFALLLAVIYVVYEAIKNAYNEHQVEMLPAQPEMPIAD